MSEVEPDWRVYTMFGKCAHLLSPDKSPQGRAIAHCGMIAGGPFDGYWYGTGTQDERETAADLPLCKRCQRVADRR